MSHLLGEVGLRQHQIRNRGVELCLKVVSSKQHNRFSNFVANTSGNMGVTLGSHGCYVGAPHPAPRHTSTSELPPLLTAFLPFSLLLTSFVPSFIPSFPPSPLFLPSILPSPPVPLRRLPRMDAEPKNHRKLSFFKTHSSVRG